MPVIQKIAQKPNFTPPTAAKSRLIGAFSPNLATLAMFKVKIPLL